jgi:hypothetical protein
VTLPLAPLKRLLDAEVNGLRGDTCQTCGAAIAANHEHVADIEDRHLLCVCPACFAAVARHPEEVRLRASTRRYLRMPSDMITIDQWDAVEIPVGIAFFFYNTKVARTVACYPSPAGAIESLLPLEAWDHILRAHATLQTLVPDIEALLVRTHDGTCDCFIVPIDTCYELIGRIRSCWSGFGGGSALAEIESFFTALATRSVQVSA